MNMKMLCCIQNGKRINGGDYLCIVDFVGKQ